MSQENETKSLSVKMSNLDILAQELVPGAAVFLESDAGPSSLYCPAYSGSGSLPGYQHDVSGLPGMPRLVDMSPAGSLQIESDLEPGQSFKTIKKKRREEDVEEEISVKKKCAERKSLKEHINIVLVGHVDAGKSTIGGQILSLTGMVDKRTLLRYQEEAQEKSRKSWYLAWTLDTNDEERAKGKTVEVGRAYFETAKKHITILDAPGHKSFVPNMIGGAAQADLAVLVVSARKGEFETGFEKGGQTREHTMLVKTAGVKHIVTVVTKMDDPTVNWDESRFMYCKDRLLPFFFKVGFKSEEHMPFIPVSGLTGQGLLEKVTEDVCPWYRGPSLIQLIDELPPFKRHNDSAFVLPVVDKYKDMGTVLMGKVEAGITSKGSTLFLMPNKVQVIVDQLWSDNIEVTSVASGENVKIKVKGIEEEEVSIGFVLCDINKPITTGKLFDAQVVILETKSIICAGFSAMMHVHCTNEIVTVMRIICHVDKKTGEITKNQTRFIKQDEVAIMRLECSGIICMEPYKTFKQLGRISLRDENKTIAVGKILKVIK